MLKKLGLVPTGVAGLALAIASLGLSLENTDMLNGYGQITGAIIASGLLLLVACKFIIHPHQLKQELQHPVLGSILSTFATALMVISNTVGKFNANLGDGLWLVAIVLQVLILIIFAYYRLINFNLNHMVPSWFIPPLGLMVADIAFLHHEWLNGVAKTILWFGGVVYVILIPMMLYRLIMLDKVADAAKPTLAILAAPTSILLAAYLNVADYPSLMIVLMLMGIALLMTLTVYGLLLSLLRLPFSPAYSAFTFPLVIGATALFKTSDFLYNSNYESYADQARSLAMIELTIATLMVVYVTMRYIHFYLLKKN